MGYLYSLDSRRMYEEEMYMVMSRTKGYYEELNDQLPYDSESLRIADLDLVGRSHGHCTDIFTCANRGMSIHAMDSNKKIIHPTCLGYSNWRVMCTQMRLKLNDRDNL